MACYLAVPLLTMYLGSLRQPMYNPKFILLVTPALHILMAAGTGAVAGYSARKSSPRMRLATFAAATVLSGASRRGFALVTGSPVQRSAVCQR